VCASGEIPHRALCFVDAGELVTTPAALSCPDLSRRPHRPRFCSTFTCLVREYSEIGDRVKLQNGVVIGGDGFGFAKMPDGRYQK
jgi:hypothetical protein